MASKVVEKILAVDPSLSVEQARAIKNVLIGATTDVAIVARGIISRDKLQEFWNKYEDSGSQTE